MTPLPSIITLRSSNVKGKAPVADSMRFGEVMLNYTDGKLFFKTNNSEVKFFSADSALDVATDESNNSFLVPFIAPSDKTGEKTDTLRVSESNPTYNPSTQTFEAKNSSFDKSTINDLTIGARIKLPPIIDTSTDISNSVEITGNAISYDMVNVLNGHIINIGPQTIWSIVPK